MMFMEIEGFDAILSTLSLAKDLYDIDRFDIVQRQFYNELCWDGYYENIVGVISSIFSGFDCIYDEESGSELMFFEDDVISEYFILVWEYGKLHKLPYNQNPYVDQAQNEVRRWLNFSNCVSWKLLAYTRTKKTAKQSKLLVRIYNCNCNAQEGVAHGLIQIYAWFANKCDEFKALMVEHNKAQAETVSSTDISALDSVLASSNNVYDFEPEVTAA
jgi:hypothetical protein